MAMPDKNKPYQVLVLPEVKNFLYGLMPRERAKALWKLGLLEELGPHLREPHAKPMRGKLWELCIDIQRKYFRVFYFRSLPRQFTLVHMYRKQTNETPEREIRTAEKRMLELKK